MRREFPLILACSVLSCSVRSAGAIAQSPSPGVEVSAGCEEAARQIEGTMRYVAAEALGRLGPKGACAVERLRNAVKDKRDDTMQMFAAEALGKIGPAALPALAELKDLALQGGHPGKAATEALAKLGPGVIPEILPWLDMELDQYGQDTKQTSPDGATILGKVGAPAVPALVEALSVPARRHGAAQALGDIGLDAEPAVPALLAACERESEADVRFVMIQALGKIGPPAKAAIPLIERVVRELALLPDPVRDELMKTTAEQALAKIRGSQRP